MNILIRETVKRHIELAGAARWLRAASALVVLASLFIPTLNWMAEIQAYAAIPGANRVLDPVNSNLSAKFSFDAVNNQWQFNKDGAASLAANIATQQGSNENTDLAQSLSQLSAQQIGGVGKKDTSLYSVNLSAKASEGITYFDNVTKLSFKMIPIFAARDGRLIDGRVVYPAFGKGQVIYTAKSNGLKEDIVLPKYIGDTLSYAYKLELPDTLEARVLGDGSIGIYSADPALFGNINFGNDEDRARVMEARKTGNKDNLVFGIPAPFIKDQHGRNGQTSYTLEGSTLTVNATDLKKLEYPLSIDPSITIDSSSDFANGNSEDAIYFGNSGQITRTEVTGGTLGSFTQATSMTTPRALMDSAVYNGYIYAVGDWTNQGTSVEYAKIQSNGSLSAWTTQATGLSNRYGWGIAAYNGYLYMTGGEASSALNTTSYAKLNADGSLGSVMTASTTFNTGRYFHKTRIYNGYIYVIGGRGDASGFDIPSYSSTRYAKLLANGDIGTWNSASTMPTARLHFGMTVYNNRMYVVGGFFYDNSPALDATKSYVNNIISADINSDGSLGAWTTSVASVSGLEGGRAEVYAGYLYILRTSDISYAPISINGQIGSFETTTPPPDYGSNGALAIYNGYLYKYGGGNSGSDLNTAWYAKINPAGTIGAFGSELNYDPSAGRLSFATVAYNNYVYVIGGTNANTGASAGMLNTARYAPINSDGSLGTWNTTSTGFNNTNSGTGGQTCSPSCAGRVNLAAGVYDGYLYIAGGISNGGNNDHWSDVQSAVICTGVNAPVSGCTGAGDLRNWTTLYRDYLTNSTTTYTEANGRSKVAMQIYNGKMYLLGGQNGTNFYSHIYVSTLTSGGGAGSFSLSAVSLPSARSGASTFVNSNRLYVVGGGDSGTSWAYSAQDKADVQFISIDPSNGNLTGSWKDANASINGGSGSSFASVNGRNAYGVAVYNGVLYVTGGFAGTTTAGLATTMMATIKTDGSLSSWTSTTSITTGRVGLGTVAARGEIYIIGGCTTLNVVFGNYCNSLGQILKTYQTANINNGGNGDIQSWDSTSSTSLSTNRSHFGSFAYNGYLFVLGGETTGGGIVAAQQQVSAPISNTGVVGAWTSIPNPPTIYGDEAWVFNEGYVYRLGGKGPTNNAFAATQYAAVCTGSNTTTVFTTNCTTSSTPGTLSSWNTGTSMNTGRSELGAVASGGYVYALGGCVSSSPRLDWICKTSTNTVEVAQINSTTGALGAWTQLSAGNSFTTSRFRHQAVAYNGYIYVIGGCGNIPNVSSSCDTDLSDVQMAKLSGAGLAADAGCGAVWCTQDVIVNARLDFAATAYNGYLYITGGAEGPFNDVRFAPIMANGSIGRWSRANTDFATARRGHGAVAYNGNLYIIGGVNAPGTTYYGDVQFAGLQTIPRISRYSALLTLNPTTEVAGVYYNGVLSRESSVTYSVAPSTGVLGSNISATKGVGVEPNPKCGLGAIYYVQIVVILKDTTTATFPESGVSNVTDITTFYKITATPPPQLRLTGGKWFYQENQRPLDTCKQ